MREWFVLSALLWSGVAGAQVLVDPTPAPVDVKPGHVLVTVHPFADGVGRADRWSALDVTIANGADDTAAAVSVSTRAVATEELRYEREIELPRGARKQVQLAYKPGSSGGTRMVTVTAAGDALRFEVPVTLLTDDDVGIAVIGLDPRGVSGVVDTWAGAVPGPWPREHASDSRRVRTGLVPIERLPERSAVWDGFDWVVWPQADPSRATPQQLTALRDWVATGGHLMLTVTDSWRAVQGSTLGEMLPVTLTGTGVTSDVVPLLDRLEAFDLGPGAAPYATAARVDVPGRRTTVLAATASGEPLWVAGSYGVGTVHVLLMDPGTAPLSDHVRREALWRRLLFLPPSDANDTWFWRTPGGGLEPGYSVDKWSVGSLAPTFSNFSALPGGDRPLRQLYADLHLAAPTTGDFYAGGRSDLFTGDVWYDAPDPIPGFESHLFTFLQDIPGVAPLPLGWLALFSIAYLVVIGPVDFLVLRALGKQPWTWVTFPAWILVFSAIGLVGTTWSKGDQAVLTRLEVVDVLPGTPLWAGNTWIGLFSTKRARLELSSDQPDAIAEPMLSRGSAWDSVAVSHETAGTLEWRAETWTLSHAVTTWTAPRGRAGVRVEPTPDALGWTVTNELGVDLDEAVLTAAGLVRLLGPIPSGGTVRVDGVGTPQVTAADLRQAVIASSRDLDMGVDGTFALRAFLEHPERGRGHVDLFGEIALVGVTRTPHEQLTVPGLRPVERSWTVYRVPLTVPDPVGAEESIP